MGRKRRLTDEEIEINKQKKIASYKAKVRDERHECRLGAVVVRNRKKYIVSVTSPLFIYLISGSGKIKRLTWKKWKGVDTTDRKVRWNKKIRDAIRVVKRTMKMENEIRKKVKKKPLIIRTPVPKKKKKKRRKKK